MEVEGFDNGFGSDSSNKLDETNSLHDLSISIFTIASRILHTSPFMREMEQMNISLHAVLHTILLIIIYQHVSFHLCVQ